MPLIIDTTECGDDLTSEEMEFCNNPTGLAHLGMTCGFGSIPADYDTRMHLRGRAFPFPKSFSVTSLMQRIRMASLAWGFTVPRFVTEDFLCRARGWDANISFVTSSRFNARMIEALKHRADRRV